MTEERELLKKIHDQQSEQTRILREREAKEQREQFLEPFRQHLEQAKTQATRSSQDVNLLAFTRAKAELRKAENDWDDGRVLPPAPKPTADERIKQLENSISVALAEERQARQQLDKTPHSVDARVAFLSARRKQSEAQKEFDRLIREQRRANS